jgi:hypothetical protein
MRGAAVQVPSTGVELSDLLCEVARPVGWGSRRGGRSGPPHRARSVEHASRSGEQCSNRRVPRCGWPKLWCNSSNIWRRSAVAWCKSSEGLCRYGGPVAPRGCSIGAGRRALVLDRRFAGASRRCACARSAVRGCGSLRCIYRVRGRLVQVVARSRRVAGLSVRVGESTVRVGGAHVSDEWPVGARRPSGGAGRVVRCVGWPVPLYQVSGPVHRVSPPSVQVRGRVLPVDHNCWCDCAGGVTG